MPPPSCRRRPRAAPFFPALGTKRPRRGAGQETLGGARNPGRRASTRVRPGSTCARPYWIPCPSHCLLEGRAGKGKTGAWVQPHPHQNHGAELAGGESRRAPGQITPPKDSPPSPQPASAPSLRDTHPHALTPRKQPGRPASAAALVAGAPRAGGRAAIGTRRRPQGSDRGGGGAGGRREDGARSLLEH